jgi:protein-L-isoaspartate(D-aspartate) O-methyltransferase
MTPLELETAYAAQRRWMVREQLAAPGYAIRNGRVLAAMAKVPRHEFVPEEIRDEAYEDHPLPIGHGQTISQPFIVAFMTEMIDPRPTDTILEIGTGSGYQAAILSELAGQVYSIEIVEPLARRAAAALKRLGYANVTVRSGDGAEGWPEAAPFDAIISTCASSYIPEALVTQLKEGGRLILPASAGDHQELFFVRKVDGAIEQTAVMPVRFVPMTRR